MCQKTKKVWRGETLIKGYEVMRWMNLMLNLHCNAMKFLRSTNALQWNNTWEIIDKCKIINAFCFELFQLCDIVFKIVNACYVYNASQLKIKVIQIKSIGIKLDVSKCFELLWILVVISCKMVSFHAFLQSLWNIFLI